MTETEKTLAETCTAMVPIKQAAAAFGVSAQVMRRYCREGRLPSFKIGQRVFIPRNHLAAFIDAQIAEGVTKDA